MPLYGHELSESINPFAAGRGLGRQARQGRVRRAARRSKASRNGPAETRVGLDARRQADRPAGQRSCFRETARSAQVTSGTFSPTLQVSLAMALVEPGLGAPGTELAVDVRGHREPARVVKLPFYKRARKADTAV